MKKNYVREFLQATALLADAEDCPAAPCSAARWLVQFSTDDDSCHPIWYGKKDGDPITREAVISAAEDYLEQEKDWLTGIADCEPVDY